MKLYEISTEYHDALNELSALEFDAETIENSLSVLKGDLECKARNVAAFIRNSQAEVDAVKEAAKKLSQRAATEQKAIDRMIDYLKFNMEQAGITEIRSPELLLKIKTNPPSVIIDDELSIDKKYKSEKVTISVDKTAIKKDIQAGNEVVGAHLEQKTRLDIS